MPACQAMPCVHPCLRGMCPDLNSVSAHVLQCQRMVRTVQPCPPRSPAHPAAFLHASRPAASCQAFAVGVTGVCGHCDTKGYFLRAGGRLALPAGAPRRVRWVPSASVTSGRCCYAAAPAAAWHGQVGRGPLSRPCPPPAANRRAGGQGTPGQAGVAGQAAQAAGAGQAREARRRSQAARTPPRCTKTRTPNRAQHATPHPIQWPIDSCIDQSKCNRNLV